ncbi:MAG: DUF881 domain-containing protein [Selenomonadaceae bacterium]|nr:DUF881 domain-containing protein [Selenomonadaceae bacterium]
MLNKIGDVINSENQNRIGLAFVSMVLGLLLTLQFRATLVQKESLPFQRIEELSARLIDTEKERDTLRAALREVTERQEKESRVANLSDLEMTAGLVGLTGPGLVITIDDSRKTAKAGENMNLYVIHDEDILRVVNELRAAGAEAISLNGQRLTATSEIRCAGPTLSVNNVRSAAPFEIIAIGEVTTLENALKMRGGVVDTLKVWGIQTAISPRTSVEVPPFNGPSPFRHAKPIARGGAGESVKSGNAAGGSAQ